MNGQQIIAVLESISCNRWVNMDSYLHSTSANTNRALVPDPVITSMEISIAYAPTTMNKTFFGPCFRVMICSYGHWRSPCGLDSGCENVCRDFGFERMHGHQHFSFLFFFVFFLFIRVSFADSWEMAMELSSMGCFETGKDLSINLW